MNGQLDVHERAERLNEIKEEIKAFLGEAKRMLRGTGITWERARSYWFAHILGALDEENEYMGGSMFTMQDTINELMGKDEEDEGMGPGGPMGSVRSMRLTNTCTRVATIPMRMDAGQLREHLAGELYKWQVEGFRSPDWVKSFWVKVKQLARMIGETKEEVHRELQEDVDRMADEEDFDPERTSNVEAKQRWHEGSEYAICTDALGGEQHTKKWEDCKRDVLRKHREGK
jgi:hypothetical protein